MNTLIRLSENQIQTPKDERELYCCSCDERILYDKQYFGGGATIEYTEADKFVPIIICKDCYKRTTPTQLRKFTTPINQISKLNSYEIKPKRSKMKKFFYGVIATVITGMFLGGVTGMVFYLQHEKTQEENVDIMEKSGEDSYGQTAQVESFLRDNNTVLANSPLSKEQAEWIASKSHDQPEILRQLFPFIGFQQK